MNQLATIAPVEPIDPETVEILDAPPAQSEPTPKRTLPVAPVLREQEPDLPIPDADRIDPNWDIAQVATRGHVLVERFFVMNEKLFWPSILIALVATLMILKVIVPATIPQTGAWAFTVGFWLILGLVISGTIMLIGGGAEVSEQSIGVIGLGAVIFGGGLWLLTWYAEQYTDGFAAWTVTLAKICAAIAAIWFVGKHVIKSYRSSESRAVIWMGGGYIAAVLVLGAVGSSLASNSNFVVQAAQSALTFDKNTYWNLGGGLSGGADLAWMADHSPKSGLTAAEHAALIKAVQEDLGKHGADAGEWEAVPALDKVPTVTRAEKAIKQYADKLPTGIVVVPVEHPVMTLVAHVEGQWSITDVTDDRCAVFLGPWSEETGCANETTPQDPLNYRAQSELAELKPTASAEIEE